MPIYLCRVQFDEEYTIEAEDEAEATLEAMEKAKSEFEGNATVNIEDITEIEEARKKRIKKQRKT